MINAKDKLDNTPLPPETRVYRISHPTKIIETDTLSRSPEAPLFHSLVELLKLMLLLLISLLLGLIYNKDIHTTITYQTSEANNQSLVCPSCPVLPPPPPPTEQLVSPPPPPTEQLVSPPPPTEQLVSPPTSNNTTDWEYKLLIWDSTYVEDCQATSQQWNVLKSAKRPNYGSPEGEDCYCGDSECIAELGPDEIKNDTPSWAPSNERFGLVPSPNTTCNTCGPQSGNYAYYGSLESDSSFVNTALKEGLTRDELFTECSYPTMSRTIKYRGVSSQYGGVQWYDLTSEQYGGSHYNFTGANITVGDSLEVVEVEVVSCVMEKLVNRIAEGGWEFIPSPSVDSLYFRRQKV